MMHVMGITPMTMILLSFVGGVVDLAAGVAMLKRQRWGRQCYLIASPLFLMLTIFLYHFKYLGFSLIGVVMYGVFFIVLTRRPVSDFFSSSIVIPSAPPRMSVEPSGEPDRTGKRIASICLLIPGGLFLNAWLMEIVPMSNVSPIGAFFISAVFGVFTLLFIVPAVFLWGRKRWAGFLGAFMSAVGGGLFMEAVVFYQLSTVEAFRQQFAQIDPDMIDQLTRGSFIFGIVSLVIGLLLIILQRTNDKKADAAAVIS